MPPSSRSPARYGVRRQSQTYASSPPTYQPHNSDSFAAVTAFIPQRLVVSPSPPSSPAGWERKSLILRQTRSAFRRSAALRVLRSWEGREYLLQLVHSLVLLLHSTLHVPPPRTGLQSLANPGSFILVNTVPRQMRAMTMQRIYTAAEGLANVRRVVLLARLIQAGTEAAMERMAAKPPRPSPPLPLEKLDGGSWLQPQSIAPFDSAPPEPTSTPSWRERWEERLSFLCNALFTAGEACDVAAFLAGSGIFWRSVGLNRLGYVSTRRRKGIERLGILLPLFGVALSLALLRLQRLRLKSEIRSAHRRIISANDSIGWSSDLAGRPIPHSQAVSASQQLPDQDDDDDDEGEEQPEEHDLQSSEYSLLRAENDLARSRRDLKWTFWEKIALYADGLFLGYDTLSPNTDKEGTEAWTGIISSVTRLARVWDEMRRPLTRGGAADSA